MDCAREGHWVSLAWVWNRDSTWLWRCGCGVRVGLEGRAGLWDREGVGLPGVGGRAWKNENVQVQKTCPGPGKGRSGWGRALDGEEGAGLIQSL